MVTTTTSAALDNIRKSFNFNVDVLPLFGPEGIRTGVYGLFRDDDGQFVGRKSVTRGYIPHQTEDLVAIAQAVAHVFDDGDIEAKCHWKQGHWVSVAPSNEYRRNVFGTNDAIFPRLLINAGYNGRAFKVSCGFYRDMCRNLSMVTGAGESIARTIRHTHSLDSRIQELIEDLRGLRKGWSDTVETIRRMSEVETNAADFIREVFPTPEAPTQRQTTIAENRIDAIYNRLARESRQLGFEMPNRNNGYRANGWLLFNAVQGYVQHDMTRRGKPGQFDRMLSALEEPVVDRAAELVLAV